MTWLNSKVFTGERSLTVLDVEQLTGSGVARKSDWDLSLLLLSLIHI